MLEKAREELGLNRPLLVQYFAWLSEVVRGNLGFSYKDGFPVADKLLRALKETVKLSSVSLLAALFVSVPLSLISYVRKGKMSDHIIRFLSFFGNSIPNFFLSILLMYVFCIRLRMFKVIADDSFSGMLLPALSLALPLAGRLTRQFTAELINEGRKDYVTGMRARGVKEHIILFKNVFRNTLGQLITYTALSIGALMGGSVVVESMFGVNGIGKLVMDSITARDYPMVQGFVLYMTVFYVVINLITDISYCFLDKRRTEL
jgi:peptide/nickel transport system permease protein